MRRVVTSPIEKRGVSGFAKDSIIGLRTKSALSHHRFKNVKILVHRKVILLVGFVQAQAEKDAAEMVVESVRGVSRVINEIEVSARESRSSFYDTILSQKDQSKMFLDMTVSSRNYHVTVMGRVIYVIGTALSEKEKLRVISLLRGTSGMRRVVVHIDVEPAQHAPKA